MADGNVKIRRRSKSKHVAPIPAVKPTYEVPKWYELLFFISIWPVIAEFCFNFPLRAVVSGRSGLPPPGLRLLPDHGAALELQVFVNGLLY